MSSYNVSDLNKVKRGPNRATYDKNTVHDILDAGFIGYLAYVFEGKAITIPMAFARIEEKVYIHGSLKNRMLLALLAAKEASMTVMHLDGLVLARSAFHHSVNYRSATIFGTVKRIEDKNEKEIILKEIVDQMVPGRWDTLRTMTDKERNATLVVEISITTASAKVRDEGVGDEKSDMRLPIWAGIVPIKQVSFDAMVDDLVPENVGTPEHITRYLDKNKP